MSSAIGNIPNRNNLSNKEKETKPPDDEQLRLSPLDEISDTLASMNIGSEENKKPALDNVSTPERPKTASISSVEEEMLKNESQLDDLSKHFGDIRIETTDNEPTNVISDGELSNFSNDKTWKDLDEVGKYKIYAFTVKYKGIMHPYVAILAQKEDDEGKSVYRLKGPYVDHFRDLFNKPDLLQKENYYTTQCNRLKIIHLVSGNHFGEFKIHETKALPKDFVFYTNSWKIYETISEKNEKKSSDLPPTDNQKNISQAGHVTNSIKSEPQPSTSSKRFEKNNKTISRMNEKKSSDIPAEDNQKNVDQAADHTTKLMANLMKPEPQPGTSKKRSAKTKKIDKEPTHKVEISPDELHLFSKDENWNKFDLAGTYKILAFTIKNIRQIPNVAILAQKERASGKKVYHLKGAYEGRFKHYFYNPELLKKEDYVTTAHRSLKIIHRAAGEPIAKFTVNGTETFENKKCPKYEDFEFYTKTWYDYQKIFGFTKEELSDLFLWDKWLTRNLNQFGEYTVFAFTVDKIKYKAVGVLVSEKNSNSKQVYILKGIPKQEFEKRFDSWHLLPRTDYGVINCNNSNIMYLKSEKPLAEFQTNGIFTYKGNSYPEVVNLRFFHDYHSPITIKNHETKSDNLFGKTKDNLSNLFKYGNWKPLDRTAKYDVYAVTLFEDGTFSDVGVLAKKENTDFKEVFRIEGDAAKEFKSLFSSKAKAHSDYKVVKLNNRDVMFLTNEQPIAKFKTNGIDEDTENQHKFPKIDELNFTK